MDAASWRNFNEASIIKCFVKSGFITKDLVFDNYESNRKATFGSPNRNHGSIIVDYSLETCAVKEYINLDQNRGV